MSEGITLVTVYGSSDDLIEIEGSVREEFTYRDTGDPGYLGFSDGTVLTIGYTDAGVWRIAVARRGTMTCVVEQAPLNDEDNYSDIATLGGNIPGPLWCLYGHALALAVPTGEQSG